MKSKIMKASVYLAVLLLVALAWLLLPAQVARADGITVTHTLDELSTNSQCSLREAISNANDDAATYPDCVAGSGTDTISLPSGTYTLTIAGQWNDTNTTGQLHLSSQELEQVVLIPPRFEAFVFDATLDGLFLF